MGIQVSWQRGCQFEIETEKGFKILADADGKHAACPTEILLAALGSCSATDVVAAIESSGAALYSLTNILTYTLTEEAPRLYRRVNLHFEIQGKGLTSEFLEQSIRTAINRYCHVCLMLQPKIEVTFSVEYQDKTLSE